MTGCSTVCGGEVAVGGVAPGTTIAFVDGKPVIDRDADDTITGAGTDDANEGPGRRDGGCEKFGPDNEGIVRVGPGNIVEGTPKGSPSSGGEGFEAAAVAAAKAVNLLV